MIIKPGDRKKIITSGLFVLFLSSVVFLSIFLINKDSSIFGKRIILNTKVSNVSNLKIGGAVQLRGIQIGSVKDIKFETLEEIIITVSVLEEYLEWIKVDSILSIQTQGILGDKFVEISGGKVESENAKPGSYLITQGGNQFDSFLNKGEDILVVAKRVLQKTDALLTAIESDKVQSIVSNFKETTKKLNQMMTPITGKRIETMLTEFSSATDSIMSISQTLDNVGKRIEVGPGTLHSLIYDRALHDDLKSIMGGAKRSKMLKYFVRESIKKSHR